MTWKRLGYVAAAVALLLFIPYTRRATLYVLPLGSGVDDVLFLVALAIAAVIWGSWAVHGLNADTRRLAKEVREDTKVRVRFVLIVGAAILLVAVTAWIMLSQYA